MANRKSRSVIAGGRSQPAQCPSATARVRAEPLDRLPGRAPPPATLEEAIEQERGRMEKARSVLGCLRHALTYQEHFEGDADRPYFADVAELAHDLLADAIHRLDSLYIAHLPREQPASSGRVGTRLQGHAPTE